MPDFRGLSSGETKAKIFFMKITNQKAQDISGILEYFPGGKVAFKGTLSNNKIKFEKESVILNPAELDFPDFYEADLNKEGHVYVPNGNYFYKNGKLNGTFNLEKFNPCNANDLLLNTIKLTNNYAHYD